MIYTCARCGKQFEAKRKTAVCPECHTAVCCVCGKKFKLEWPYTAVTCSAECRGKYMSMSGKTQVAHDKAKQTVKEKGSKNVLLKPRKCEYCGKLFIPNSNRQKYCGDDYGSCPVCGKSVKIKDMSIGPQACSYECRQKLIEKTNLEKYCVKNVFQSDSAKQKSKETCLEKYGVERYQSTSEYREKYLNTMNDRYGVDHPLQSEEIKDKWVNTNLKKYGTEYPMQNENVKKKSAKTAEDNYGGFGMASEELSSRIKQTNLEKYGHEYPLQNENIKNKMKATNLEKYGVEVASQNEEVRHTIESTNLARYGSKSPLGNESIQKKSKDTVKQKYGVDNVFQLDEVKDKTRYTNLEKYGYENPMKNEDIKNKAKKTSLERYGSEYWNSSDEKLKIVMTDPSKIEDYKNFRDDARNYIQNHFDDNPTLTQIADKTGVDITTISAHVILNHCEDLIDYKSSNSELEIKDFLLTLVDESEIVEHDRKQIKPQELDFYLPNYNFAIECNPTYTHNSIKSSFGAPEPIPMSYHKNKSIACRDKGIFLFHVFGYEWTNKKEIIKSMIRNILGKNERVIYGRNTYVCEISQKELSEFLNKNHRQGSTTAKIRLGLRLKQDDSLVSVMSFSKLRNSLGRKQDSSENDMELSRFCSLININVVGGASKLFKYFKEHYDYDKIVSFSDVAHTRGSLYENLGFKQVSISDPDYVWVDPKTDRYYTRVSCQKKYLPKLFDEPNLDIRNQSESQIMQSHGFVRVYDCGVIRWEYEA